MTTIYEIPDDVWEGRCQWCVHRQGNENRKIPAAWMWRYCHDQDKPCRIMSVSRPNDIPGECRSFAPNHIFGICATCKHDSSFGEDHCDRDGQPNKRQVFIGQGYQDEAYWGVHRLSTCDGYEPDSDWFDIMRREAAEGKIPRNFNPETMQPIGDGFEETKAALTAWEKFEEDLNREREQKEAERRRKKAERIAEETGQIPGQTVMDLGGQNDD